VIDIKAAVSADAAQLSDLAENTFLEAFSKDNLQENLDLYVEQTFSPEKQLQEILDPSRNIAIAWMGDVAVGFYHLFVSEPDPSVIGEYPIELLRLYVDSKWHGKGVGPALMKRCIQDAGSDGFKTLWLGVWERNFRAQAFYRKFSFVEVGKHVFALGKDNQTDLIMTRGI
jgi:GNAT superfamily N-acetyltransferase